MRLCHVWVYGLSLTLAATMVGCGGGQETSSTSATPASPAGAPAGMKVDTGTAGSVTGSIVVEGALPKNLPIRMNADPVCVKEASGTQLAETYHVGSDGKTLGNVFVHVKDGLGNYVFDTPTEVAKLDQKGCRYVPHVFGVRVGQPIEITNSDPTLHNIHAMPKDNSEFNTAQPLQNMKITQTFDKKEVMVPFKCEVHGWMNAFIGVLDHPYFAVTGDSGKFELKDLPAGTYTIEAWHEKLGTQTQSVTLGEKETKDISFTFKAPAAATN